MSVTEKSRLFRLQPTRPNRATLPSSQRPRRLQITAQLHIRTQKRALQTRVAREARNATVQGPVCAEAVSDATKDDGGAVHKTRVNRTTPCQPCARTPCAAYRSSPLGSGFGAALRERKGSRAISCRPCPLPYSSQWNDLRAVQQKAVSLKRSNRKQHSDIAHPTAVDSQRTEHERGRRRAMLADVHMHACKKPRQQLSVNSKRGETQPTTSATPISAQRRSPDTVVALAGIAQYRHACGADPDRCATRARRELRTTARQINCPVCAQFCRCHSGQLPFGKCRPWPSSTCRRLGPNGLLFETWGHFPYPEI